MRLEAEIEKEIVMSLIVHAKFHSGCSEVKKRTNCEKIRRKNESKKHTL